MVLFERADLYFVYINKNFILNSLAKLVFHIKIKLIKKKQYPTIFTDFVQLIYQNNRITVNINKSP